MPDPIAYEADVYSRIVRYKNYLGEEKQEAVYFALDPLELLQIIADFNVGTVKSGNPARNGQQADVSEGQRIGFIRDLASRAAGTPSDDGESWIPTPNFDNTLMGKAFMTKLASSDGDRREFTQMVVLSPFRAFVNYAKQDESNSAQDRQEFELMLAKIEKIFEVPDPSEESIEVRRARLQEELDSMEALRATNETPPIE